MSALRSRLRTAALFAVTGGLIGVGLALALFGVVLGGGVASAQSVTFETVPVAPLAWSYPRCLESTTEMAQQISDCMIDVMHPRAVAGGGPAEVDADSAAFVCRRVRSTNDSHALQSCVRSLMYDRGGLGDRRAFISGADAAIACRYGTNVPNAEVIEDCMKRLLFTRSGLGTERTEVSPTSAAYTCQAVVAPPPLIAWPYVPVCSPPQGEEASRFLEDCIKRLLYTRDGLGERRPNVTAAAASIACEGAISWYP